jgi:uncharacterized protein (AIM24 family)
MVGMARARSVPPPSTDERTTERRLIPSSPYHESVSAESKREVSQEDFLFHLYRGSELLQENRVHEAKEELESALTMQPSDPKGQDLLAAVYFRLGMYPRAIQIYEGLEVAFPNDVSIKVNLALGYLKTGQPDPARRVLQEAVRIQPEHKRAWGYLGLALQKVGDLEAAQIAFERGGHAMMAKRMNERRPRPGSIPPPSSALDEGVRSVAETAFSELDAGELKFALAEPGRSTKAGDADWHTLELGEAAKVPRSVPPPAISVGASLARETVHETKTVPPPSISTRLVPPPMPGPEETPATPPDAPAPGPESTVVPSLLGPVEGPTVTLHASGVVLVRLSGEIAVGTRLDALRVVAGTITSRVLHRRTNGSDTAEVLGGIGSPFVRVSGDAQVVLGPRPAHRLVALTLDDELAFVREESLLAFEMGLAYENGRLALDPPGEGPRSGETAHVAQLRGRGALVVEVSSNLASLPCVSGTPLLVRREWIVAWLGRMLPRALPPTESPSGQRGLVSFSGNGTVLVCAG